MKHPLLYIAEMLFCSGAFLLLWHTVLVGKISFRASRAFLLLSIIAAAAIPALEIPLYPAQNIYYEVPLFVADHEAAIPYGASAPESAPENLHAAAPAWKLVARTAYIMVSAFALAMVVVRCRRIALLRRRSRIAAFDGYFVARSKEIASPFSFMRTIFLPDSVAANDIGHIITHELSHIRHRHSLERIVMEIMRSLLWFNPFVWISARALVEVHEWEADRDVLDTGHDLTQYRITIFKQLFGYNPDITCGLAHSKNSITKKRFIMMTRKSGEKLSFMRLSAVAILTAGLVLAFGCTGATATTSEPIKEQIENKKIPTISITSSGYTLNGVSAELVEIERTMAAENRIILLIADPEDKYQSELAAKLDKALEINNYNSNKPVEISADIVFDSQKETDGKLDIQVLNDGFILNGEVKNIDDIISHLSSESAWSKLTIRMTTDNTSEQKQRLRELRKLADKFGTHHERNIAVVFTR